MTALEVEPTTGRYLAFLKPESKAWYVDAMVFIGTNLYEATKDEIQKLRQEAVALGAAPRFQSWSGKAKFKVPTASIDMALFSDGAVARLGPSFETALLEVNRVLKDTGIIYVVATEEDE